MQGRLNWTLGSIFALLVVGVPVVHYRSVYTNHKRLREVDGGRLYRSGQLTVAGFRDAVARYGIKTFINAQDEYPDPDVGVDYWNPRTMKESELCKELGVRYVHLPPDLIARRSIPRQRPEAIDRFLEIMDQESNHPVLLHCKAGLHRTGVLTAVYRMEYQHWPLRDAAVDLKANGFGDVACTSANDYIVQYLLSYRPGVRNGLEARRGADPDHAAATKLAEDSRR